MRVSKEYIYLGYYLWGFDDPNFEDDVDLEENDDNNKREDTYKTRRQEFRLSVTKITRLLKIGVEREWFNTKQIFHLYSVRRIVYDCHLAYMLCATWRTSMHAIWRSSIVSCAHNT